MLGLNPNLLVVGTQLLDNSGRGSIAASRVYIPQVGSLQPMAGAPSNKSGELGYE